ncbi:MAG: sulfatase-like hydrolase/transferase [Planctomycetales bacterium]|nr:sulfatase-like hydrolase/transferase [Planctomycetales bacterium]
MKNYSRLSILITLTALFSLVCVRTPIQADEKIRPNVLFIAVDDLNHWVGHLGRNRQTKTPNLDRLAKMGVTFTNSHCAAPVCNPSRTALLSGMRPGSTGVYDNNNPYGSAVNVKQSLVTQFKDHGYITLGMGKLWHGGLGFEEQWTETRNEEPKGSGGAKIEDRSIGGIALGVIHGDDSAVSDTQIADYGISELSKSHDKPFFLTLGFHKPHMPWNVPQKYYDMHPLDQIELPPTKNGDLADVPSAGLKMAKASGDHTAVLKSGRWKEAVQAYLAAISYLDGQVGRVLDALEQSSYKDNTIICLWGDHGWHLGEKEHWRKFALWEEATRAPLIWVVPGTTTPGGVCKSPVDFMAIYPTLCDLADIPLPRHVEGQSIRGLLKDPNAASSDVAITTFGQNNHAVRTDRWRYIRYADGGEELYDHSNDEYEWTNLAALPEHEGLKKELADKLPARNVAAVTRNGAEKKNAKSGESIPGKKNRQQKKQNKALRDPETSEARAALVPEKQRPNIVWMIVEDMSAHYSCYGETTIQTPNVDQLASRGTRFSRAFVTAPICSICRSALITGRYQTSIGAQNHRSGVSGHEIHLPADVKLVPAIFRNAGYHTNNLTVEAFLRSDEDVKLSPVVKVAKTDYNFQWDEAATYDSTHWAAREAKKPFFVQVQLHGGKYRNVADTSKWTAKALKDLGSVTSPNDVHLPPYLPNDPVILEDWAQYLDTVRYTDWEVGRVIQRLKDAGELENTVIFFMTDHGISHVRNKQFLYDGGTHVPLIVAGPGVASGVVRDDVVEHIDLGATSMGCAGIARPASMHSQDIMAADYQPREYVFAARDRADETVDLMRSVRDTRWKYIFNGFPDRPYLQPNRYKDSKPILQAMRRLYADAQLNADQSLIMAEARPREELYDTQTDPFELHNLAGKQEHQSRLETMRTAFRDWQKRTGDPGVPESEDIYKIEVGAKHLEGGKNADNTRYKNNVELMLKWNTERPFVP